MTLNLENDQEKLEHARRSKAINSAAASFVVGWFISGILYNIFVDSSFIPYWLLISITLFIPFCLSVLSWQTAMKIPPPADPNAPRRGIGLKRFTAFVNALAAFFIAWLMVGALLGQAMDGVSGEYAILANILPMILPLGIGIMVYKNIMKPKNVPTHGFEVIFPITNIPSEKPNEPDSRK